jgi:hypothetical protein
MRMTRRSDSRSAARGHVPFVARVHGAALLLALMTTSQAILRAQTRDSTEDTRPPEPAAQDRGSVTIALKPTQLLFPTAPGTTVLGLPVRASRFIGSALVMPDSVRYPHPHPLKGLLFGAAIGTVAGVVIDESAHRGPFSQNSGTPYMMLAGAFVGLLVGLFVMTK